MAFDATEPGWGLVLGGGGAVGTAYIAGVLLALEEHGLDARTAGLVVGTSAGAFVGARIRLGDRSAQLLALADVTPAAGQAADSHFEKAWSSPAELSRRLVGTSGVLARSFLRAPLPLPSQNLSRIFPPGLFRVKNQARLSELLPDEWPADPIWSVALDLGQSKRVALGSEPEHFALPFRDTVLASCAVPGFYEPVRMNGTMYVDGGVRSTTHLDLAIRNGCHKVICIVPLGYQDTSRPVLRHRLLRRSAVRGLRRELSRLGRRTQDVLVIQPPIADLDVHGTNVMRGSGNAGVSELSYTQMRGMLTRGDVARFIDGVAARA